jgi:hypothetical protein
LGLTVPAGGSAGAISLGVACATSGLTANFDSKASIRTLQLAFDHQFGKQSVKILTVRPELHSGEKMVFQTLASTANFTSRSGLSESF